MVTMTVFLLILDCVLHFISKIRSYFPSLTKGIQNGEIISVVLSTSIIIQENQRTQTRPINMTS